MKELLIEDFRKEAKQRFLMIINDLEQRGAQGMVLGCIEIALLIKQEDIRLPVFNILEIHAKTIVDCALGDWGFY